MNLRQMIKLDARKAITANRTANIFIVLFTLAINCMFLYMLLFGEALLQPNTPQGVFNRLIGLAESKNFIFFLLLLLGIYVLELFCFSPYLLAKHNFFYQMTKGKIKHISTLFQNYKEKASFFKSVKLYTALMFFRILTFLVSAFPGITCITVGFQMFFLAESNSTSGTGIMLLILGFLLLLLGLAGFCFLISRFFLVPYLYAQNDKLPIRMYFKRSQIYMRGRETQIIGCVASFIPLLLSGVFIIPMFFAYTYFSETMAIYARFFIEQNEMQKPAVYTPSFY